MVFLGKRGDEGGMDWVGYAILVVIALFVIYFVFHLGLFGNVKEGIGKFFGSSEEYVNLYKEHFEEEEKTVDIDKKTEDIKAFIIDSFNIGKNDCLGVIDLSRIKDIDDLSVYFVNGLERVTKFYIFKGGWRDDLDKAIIDNKYIKYGSLNKNINFYYNNQKIDTFLLSNNFEYINFIFNKKKTTVKLINPGFVDIISVTGEDKGEIFTREKKVTNFKILNPVFYYNNNDARILNIDEVLERDLTKDYCSIPAVEYK